MIRDLLKKYKELNIVKKSVLWFTIATLIQNGILFLVTPIYTRVLPEQEYGVFSVYQSWQQIISIISVLALDRCITVGFMKFKDSRKEFLSSVQVLMTVLVFICSVIVIIFSETFKQIIDLPMNIIVCMLIVSLMNNTLSNWSWFQRYNYSYVKLAVVTVVSTLAMQVFALVGILVLPYENKGILLVLLMSIARIIMYGVLYVKVLKNGRTGFNKQYWKFALKYSIAVVPHALSQIILNVSDRIMIDKLCGKAEAAYYGVVYSVAMVLNVIITSIGCSVQPWFFEKIEAKDFLSIKNQTNKLLIISAFLAVSVASFAPEILTILAPKSYEAALWVFPSIAAGIYFYSMYLYFSNFESYYEKPIYFSIATTVGAVINIVLNYLLIPILGFVVAGYTTLVSYMIFAFMHYLFMRKICKDKLNNVKVFDMKFISILSILVIIVTLGITQLYYYTLLRYAIILSIVLMLIIFRNRIIKEIKLLINKA